MNFISLTCPNCSGDIELDNAKEFGFCMHCGHKVLLRQSVPQKIKLDESEKIEKLLKMGRSSLNAINPKELRDISNRILEIDADNCEGWFFKGCAAMSEFEMHEAFEYWDNAINHQDDQNELRSMYSMMIELTTGSFSIASLQGKFLNTGGSVNLSFSTMNKIKTDGSEVGPYLLGDLIEGFKSKFENVSDPQTLGTFFGNYSMFFFNSILFECDMRELLNHCNDFIQFGKEIQKQGSKLGISFERRLSNKIWMKGSVGDEIEFYEILKKEIERNITRYSDEKIDEIAEYWINCEDENKPYEHLSEASDLHMDLFEKSMMESMRIKKKRNNEIEQFVRNMLEKRNE